MSQGQWYALEIRNSSSRVLQVGYSIELSFDHQSLVSQGASIGGSNLAIVSNQNGNTTALHRVLDPQSGWNRRDTKIWFAADQIVPALQTTSQQFYLVVDHPTLGVKSNPNQVFHRWADFKSNNPLNTWNATQSSAGIAGRTMLGNHVSLYAEASSVIVYSDYSHEPLSLPQGFVFETRAQSRPMSGSYAGCNRSHTLIVRDAGNNQLYAALRLTDANYYFESYDRDLRAITAVSASERTTGDSTWHTYGVAWDAQDMHLTRDGLLLHQRSGASLPAPNQQSLRLGFRAIADGAQCAQAGQSQLDVDWARVRYYNHPGPVASLVSPP